MKMHDLRLFSKVYCVQTERVIDLLYHFIEDSSLYSLKLAILIKFDLNDSFFNAQNNEWVKLYEKSRDIGEEEK